MSPIAHWVLFYAFDILQRELVQKTDLTVITV